MDGTDVALVTRAGEQLCVVYYLRPFTPNFQLNELFQIRSKGTFPDFERTQRGRDLTCV